MRVRREQNIDQLREKSFVFICIDQGEPKKVIATKLHEWNIPFVDVGMGVYKAGESLGRDRASNHKLAVEARSS